MKLKLKNIKSGVMNGLAVGGGVIAGKKLADQLGDTLPSFGNIRAVDILLLASGALLSGQKGIMANVGLGIAGAGVLGIARTQFGIEGAEENSLDMAELAAYVAAPGYYEMIGEGNEMQNENMALGGQDMSLAAPERL